jgi:hypothetical protein
LRDRGAFLFVACFGDSFGSGGWHKVKDVDLFSEHNSKMEKTRAGHGFTDLK